ALVVHRARLLAQLDVPAPTAAASESFDRWVHAAVRLPGSVHAPVVSVRGARARQRAGAAARDAAVGRGTLAGGGRGRTAYGRSGDGVPRELALLSPARRHAAAAVAGLFAPVLPKRDSACRLWVLLLLRVYGAVLRHFSSGAASRSHGRHLVTTATGPRPRLVALASAGRSGVSVHPVAG